MAANATCYDPQHQPGPEGAEKYEACWSDNSDGHSACCPQGWTCLKNLLCLSTGTDTKNFPQGTLQRGLCTDKTFASPNCPQFCLGGANHPNNGTLVKNCGDGTGCCHGAKDCSCTVDSPDALLLGAQSIVPYTTRPTTAIVLLGSGMVVSTSKPPTVTTTMSSISVSITAATNSPTSGTTNSTATPATFSGTTDSSLKDGVLMSAATATQIQASPSLASTLSSQVPKPSARTPNLGLVAGIPIVAVVVVISVIVVFLMLRRRLRKQGVGHGGAARIQLLHNQDEFHRQVWDYQTVTAPTTPTRSKSKPGNYYDSKPLPTPRISVFEEASPTQTGMHELPDDEWMPKELPAALSKNEHECHEMG